MEYRLLWLGECENVWVLFENGHFFSKSVISMALRILKCQRFLSFIFNIIMKIRAIFIQIADG